jgi:hypothetical protein
MTRPILMKEINRHALTTKNCIRWYEFAAELDSGIMTNAIELEIVAKNVEAEIPLRVV